MSAEQSPTARLVVVYYSMTSSIILVPSKTILEQKVLCHSLILTNSVRISREQFFLFLRYGSLKLFFFSGNQAKHFLVFLTGICVIFDWLNIAMSKFFQKAYTASSP